MPLLVAAGLQEPDVFAADMRQSQKIGLLAVWFDCDGLLVPFGRHARVSGGSVQPLQG
jgi:hypothetical protein